MNHIDELNNEWDILLSVYPSLDVVGKIAGRKRLKEIQDELNRLEDDGPGEDSCYVPGQGYFSY